MKTTTLIAILVAATLSGCNDKSGEAIAPQQAPVAATSLKAPYSKTEWIAAFRSTFEMRKAKTDSDGVTDYLACFDPAGEKCGMAFGGMKDGFRKVDHLTPVITRFHEFHVKYPGKKNIVSFIDMRTVASECRPAVAVLNPTVHANNWLFMNKVAFMADGEVVYEKAAKYQDVKRDTEDSKVWERWAFELDRSDFGQMEKFASAQSKVIRIAGEKGYTTLDKESVDVFASDVGKMMQATLRINEALAKGGGPECLEISEPMAAS